MPGTCIFSLEEMHASGISARLFEANLSVNDMFAEEFVEIIAIHQLSSKPGPETIHPDSFEGNNLVLVDEGHRGTGADASWMNHRRSLCEGGFSFEYSATFGQSIGEGKNDSLKQEYMKSILFDYSYKHFFVDGYGKDYNILNLSESWDELSRRLYLTGCLLSFFQQLIVFRDNSDSVKPFNIEKPLLAYVGASVNAVRKQSGKSISDVLEVVLFLSSIVESENSRTIDDIRTILTGESGLNVGQIDIFSDSFEYLKEKYPHNVQELFSDLLKEVFHASSSGYVHLEKLKADGEIGLKIGFSGKYFGVINIGDTGEFIKLCTGHNQLVLLDKSNFSSSLFQTVNQKDSQINVVIGSKKFVEGWNCWRVSTMGLLHVGKSAGSEIIQLFGRGVRLKGYKSSLTRTNSLKQLQIQIPEYIDKLETLRIFGVKADYMAGFREYLRSEGVAVDDVKVGFTLPTIKDFAKGSQLKTLRLDKNFSYPASGERPSLDEEIPEQILSRPVPLNWYKNIQMESSVENVNSGGSKYNEEELRLDKHLAFVDWDQIWFDLLEYRSQRGFHQLKIPRDAPRNLFENSKWYRLQIPPSVMEPKRYEDFSIFQKIVECLVKKYAERFYRNKRSEWEGQHLKYIKIENAEENFVTEYRIMLEKNAEELLAKLETIKNEIESKKMPTALEYGNLEVISDKKHLYHPLLHLKEDEDLKGIIEISPAALNKGERNFVGDLTSYYKENLSRFSGKEVFLIRNRGRGHGIGFFDAGNFYPDFILWVVDGDKQSINFVDPHGLVHSDGLSDPKIMFSSVIKEKEAKLIDQDPNIEMNSFIVSVTPYELIARGGVKGTKQEFEESNVLFQIDDKTEYISKMFDKILDCSPPQG